MKFVPQIKCRLLCLAMIACLVMPAMRAQTAAPIPQRYAIVAWEDCREALAPFVEWKAQMGFEVVQLYTATNNCDSIRQRLLTLYQEATPLNPAPRYVLLVGDVDRIGAFAGRHLPSTQFGDFPTDLYYGEYTGDYLPEAMVGRFSISSPQELQQVISKSMDYERLQLADTNYLQRVMLVAGYESSQPAPTTTNGQVNYLKQRFLDFAPETDTICFYNPESDSQGDSIAQMLRQGNGIVNYTAHCLADGWLRPSLTNHDIDTAYNSGKYQLYVNNCCLSNRFTEHCFGEQLLRWGDAIGVIGASNETLWEEDYYWSVGVKYPLSLMPQEDPLAPGAFDRMMRQREYASQGGLMQAGNRAVSQAGSPNAGYYWEIYNLLGDPALMPYIGIPAPIEMEVLSVIPGCIAIQGTPGAVVAATKGSQLLGLTQMDSTGNATLYLIPGIAGDSIRLTASMPYHRPFTTDIPTIATQGLSLVRYQFANREECTLVITLKNNTSQTISGHRLQWQGIWYDITTMAPGDSLQLTLSHSLPIGEELFFCSTLNLSNGNGVYDQYQLLFDQPLPHPIAKLSDIKDGSFSPVMRLLPGQEYEAIFSTNNPTDTICRFACNGTWHEVMPHDSALFEVPFQTQRQPIQLTWETSCGNYSHNDTRWLEVNSEGEDFEGSSLQCYPWQNSYPFLWTIDSTQSHSGHYSARSATIGKLLSSSLSLSLDVLQTDSLTFWRKTSSEHGCDKLLFLIDGSVVGTWSGLKDWHREAFLLTKGQHHLQWIYTKDGSGYAGEDCAWIDGIRFPLALWSHLCGADSNLSIISPETTDTAVQDNIPFAIYPNPANHQVTLSNLGKSPCQVTLYDALGRKIDEISIDISSSTQYSTANLRLGTYIVLIKTEHNCTAKKLTVTH